jgi:hypothetical protein
MFHCTIQVRGGFEQDPQLFEGLHTLNNVTFKHKLLAWVNKIKHHDFCFFHTFTISPRSAQNCWSASNCRYSPTSDSDVKARSSAKSNNHTCTFAKVGCRNPSIWLATKARGLRGCGPRSRSGSHITCSRECKECEGVNPHTPK